MSVDEIKRNKIARIKCDKSLIFFTRYFFKKLKNQKFILNWHHDVICNELEKVSIYETEFLNINMPPRTSKTELVVNFIAKNLGKNPLGNYLYITASDDLRSETSVKIRDIITSNEYKELYGIELKKDQNAKNLWRTLQGGGLKTATISGQITGFGAGQMKEHNELIEYIRDFEGCIVLDDINKISDASDANVNNEKANNRIFDTVFSRKNSRDTPIINIQQRAGMDDATARLLKYYNNKPNVVNLVLPIIYNDKPLWEWKMNMQDIEDLKTNPETAHVFDTQYMQNPTPKEGLVFPESELTFYDNLNDNEGVTIGYIDTADEGIDNLSMPIIKIIIGKGYIVNVLFNQFNLTVNKSHVLAMIDKHNIDHVFVESNSFGAFFIREIKELTKVPIRGVKNTTNKLSRILAQSGWVVDNIIFDKNYHKNEDYRKFMQQLTRYLKSGKEKKDDAPDSLAGLAYVLRVQFKSLFT